MQQLDIFADSDDVRCRNDFAAAVLAGDAAAAGQRLDDWRESHPGDAFLADAAELAAWLQDARSAMADDAQMALDDLRALRRRLEEAVTPAARAVLAAEADGPSGWLAVQWRRIARCARGVAWHGAAAEVHRAPLLLQAGDWSDAAEAVATIDSWRRIPQPLAWMAEARWRAAGADAAWPLLAEAFWLAPARAHSLLARLLDARADRRLRQAMRRFEDDFEIGGDEAGRADWAWWPAWLAVDQPLLAEVLGRAEAADAAAASPAAEGFRLVAALLRMERSGRHPEIVAARKRLSALEPRLFAAYMRTR